MSALVGGVAGAALGYIVGGSRGARVGYRLGTNAGKSSPNNMVVVRGRTIDRNVRRRTSTGGDRSGSRPVTSRGSGGRRVRPTHRRKRTGVKARRARKAIKQIVKDTLQCTENVGTYTKVYTGEIEPICTADDQKVAYSATRVQGNIPPHSVIALQFLPHTSKKILDAASVVYNSKPKSIDYTTVGDFAAKGFKLDVIYASYSLEVWNYTDMAYEIDMIEVTNKSSSNANVLSIGKELHEAMDWVNVVPYWNPAAGNQFDIQHGLKFGSVTGLEKKYMLKHDKKIVYPGHKHTYFSKMSGCIDFNKNLLGVGGGTATLATYVRGEKQVVIAYRPVLHLQGDGTGNYVSSMEAGFGASNRGFLTKVVEKYKFVEPDETPVANSGEKHELLTDIPQLSGVDPYNLYMNDGPTRTAIQPALA